MKSRKYLVYDVFTEKALAGNPLGVVLDCEGLDTEAMQAIAREFNLSESVFILPPDNPRHRARVRIFTPDYEMPFAGHPTVGAAIALAEQAADDGTAGMFVLEENIGPVRCAVTKGKGATFAEFDLPKLPEQLPLSADAAALGAALGLGRARDRLREPSPEPVVGRRALCDDPGRQPRWRRPASASTTRPGWNSRRPRARGSWRPPMSIAAKRCITTAPSMRACSCPAIPPTRIRRPARPRRRSPARSCISTGRWTGPRAILDRAGHRDGPAVADQAGDRRRRRQDGRRAHRRACGEGGRGRCSSPDERRSRAFSGSGS